MLTSQCRNELIYGPATHEKNRIGLLCVFSSVNCNTARNLSDRRRPHSCRCVYWMSFGATWASRWAPVCNDGNTALDLFAYYFCNQNINTNVLKSLTIRRISCLYRFNYSANISNTYIIWHLNGCCKPIWVYTRK